MFSAIKSFLVKDSSNQNKNQANQIKENKPLKSDVSNNNDDSNKKKTIIKGKKMNLIFQKNMRTNQSKILHQILHRIHQIKKKLKK